MSPRRSGTNSRVYSFGTIDGTQYAQAAIPFDRIKGKKQTLYVLAVPGSRSARSPAR